MTKTAYFTIYNYATRRTDLNSEDLSAFVKKIKAQAKRGRRVAKFMSSYEHGRTYYWVAIQ